VRLLTAQVETFKVLGLLNLLDAERQVRATDADVAQIQYQATHYRHDIKAVLNLTISEKMTPIAVVQALLGKVGLKLTCIGRDVADDGRRGGVRIYQYQPPNDDRDTIFTQWQQRDAIAQAKQAEAERLTTLEPVLAAKIDPPPDINVLNQSASGLGKTTTINQSVPPFENNRVGTERLLPNVQVGSFVRRVRQACCWMVIGLEEATAKLKRCHGPLECTVPLSDVIVIPREGFP